MFKFLLHILISSIIFSSLTTFLIAQVTTFNPHDEIYIELVKDINPGYPSSNPHKITDVNGNAFFIAYESSGYGLWQSDGTTEGTKLVIDLDDPDISDNYGEFIVFNNELFFRAADTQSGLGSELWATDGTPEGTRLVKDIHTGESWGFPGFFKKNDSLLFFLASSEDPVNGGTETELWCSDGTTERTYMVKDIWPGPYHSSGGPGLDGYTSSGIINGIYYFAALGPSETVGENTIGGLELWRSDGTEAGTYIVVDLTPTYDVIYGTAWSRPNNLIEFKNKLFFSAAGTNTGNELYQSDGTAAGTELIKNICPDGETCCGSIGRSYPGDFVIVGDLLYFTACDGIHGRELWKTDGTEEGTEMVIDLTPGEGSTTFYGQTAFNGLLYFVYDDGDEEHGNELWCTDGTADGTILVKDIAAGVDVFNRANNSNPDHLTVVNNIMYFSAGTPEYGRELWMTDGTEEGTKMIYDLHPSAGFGSNPYALTNISGTLFFSARSYNFTPDLIETGYELWKLTSEPTEVKSASDHLEYRLHQNYPNPFNPYTSITFSIPKRDIVTIKIYNILGGELKVLLNEELEKGYHKINFDASALSSGVYFYSLMSRNYKETRKLILMK